MHLAYSACVGSMYSISHLDSSLAILPKNSGLQNACEGRLMVSFLRGIEDRHVAKNPDPIIIEKTVFDYKA